MAKLGYSTTNGKGLSYSRLGTLETCNRKYEIENEIGYRPTAKNMTFAYGHFVGASIQEYIATGDLDKSIFAGIMEFDLDDPFAVGTFKEERAKKDLWHAIDITEKFALAFENDPYIKAHFKDLEIATFERDGKEVPALELTFEIIIPDEDDPENPWKYEGHIDAVLYNRKKDEYIILELKTSGSTTIHRASYQNSAQALGYSIVLDSIVKHKNANSSFSVLYLVAKSSKKEFEVLKFPKSVLKRSQWINTLLIKIQYIEMLRNAADESGMHYPLNGASCFNFFKPCEYLDECELSNDRFYERLKEDDGVDSYAEQEPVMFSFSIEDIIARQSEMLTNKIPVQELQTDYGLEEF